MSEAIPIRSARWRPSKWLGDEPFPIGIDPTRLTIHAEMPELRAVTICIRNPYESSDDAEGIMVDLELDAAEQFARMLLDDIAALREAAKVLPPVDP